MALDKAEIPTIKFDDTNYSIWNFLSNFLLKEKVVGVILRTLKAYEIAVILRKSNSGRLMMPDCILDVGISYYKHWNSFEGM